jgi:hypothetical protein
MACAPRPISILQAIDDPKLFGSAVAGQHERSLRAPWSLPHQC